MKKGYLFISNSSKPTKQQSDSLEPVTIGTFGLAPINAANIMGYKLYCGVNRAYPEKLTCTNFNVEFYDQHSYRSIFAIKDNWIAFRNLNKYLKEHPDIKFIHCNTPIGGVLGRVCGKINRIPIVVYTAHGFHFFKGAPLFNRTILKWMEVLMARWTDVILTMNKEDYEAALKMKLKKGGKVYYIPGVGVETDRFNTVNVDVVEKKRSLGLPEDAFVGIAMGDVIPRKNYKTTIESIAKVSNTKVHYIICGRGDQIEELKKYAKSLGIENQIHFLGFRTDIMELSLMADFFLFASLQEGLPRSTMEAMCAGKPCIVSKVRGHVDLIDEGKGGFLVSPLAADGFAEAIKRLIENPVLREEMGNYNREKVKAFDIEVVKSKMLEIYQEILNCD